MYFQVKRAEKLLHISNCLTIIRMLKNNKKNQRQLKRQKTEVYERNEIMWNDV